MRYALVFALLCSAHARTNTQVQVVDTLQLFYFVDNENAEDNDDNYFLAMNRLAVTGSAGDIETRARVDAMYPVDAPDPGFHRDARLERLSVVWRLGDVTLEAGDVHAQLGRSIALTLKPVESAGIDTALRGGRVQFQTDLQRAEVFAGRLNTVNVDTVNYHFQEDVDDIMVGGRYAIAPEGWPELGVHGLYLQFDSRAPTLDEEAESNIIGGVSLDVASLVDWAALYLEYDHQRRRTILDVTNTASAAYLSLDLSLGETQVLIEGVRMDEFIVTGSASSATDAAFRYNRPPPLERFDMETVNLENYTGGRVRAERPLFHPDVVGHLNGMYRLEQPDTPNEIQQIHGYGGVEAYVGGRLFVDGGYRDERRLEEGTFEPFKSITHAGVEYGFEVFTGHELKLDSEFWLRTATGDKKGEIRGFEQFLVLLTFERGGVYSVTYEFGLDTQDPRDEVRKQFHAAILTWKVADALDLRAIGGTQRGGLKCVAGVCREYPPFAGGQLEVVARY